MAAVMPAPAPSRLLMSGNEAVARAVWEAGVRVAAAYPGTPSTEMLEVISTYPDIDAKWSVNEKVSLEVAIGAAYAGSRSFCAMKHGGLNVAADALMTLTLTGVVGGLVIAVADDVGLSSSPNEQGSRFWGRFAHLPVLEPADSQEAYAMTKAAFDLSEEFAVPVLLRLTTRICRAKALVTVGERVEHAATGFRKDTARWVMTPDGASKRLPLLSARERELANLSDRTPLNVLERGAGTKESRRVGFVTSGPAYRHVRECFPDAPVLKLGLSYPLPMQKIRGLAEICEDVVVVEAVEPLIETEIRAEGVKAHGKDILPRLGELSPAVLRPAIGKLLGGADAPVAPDLHKNLPRKVFPRSLTIGAACPHLGVYDALSQINNVTIADDIGCYALGLDKGRGEADKNKRILAVIGDSTFLHMGMQGLLDIVHKRGNVTILLLDNRAVGMTGGQNNPGKSREIHGNPAPRVDFGKLVEALGVNPDRIKRRDPYELPTLLKTIRDEIEIAEPSVIIITSRPGAKRCEHFR